MRRLSAEAYVLDVVDLHDRDRIVTFLTAESGLKRGVTKGARTKYSRFAGQLQPLAKVDVRWFEKSGRDLVRVEGLELLRPCRSLLDDLEGILLAGYLADHLVQFAQEDEESPELFRLLESSLAWLESGISRDLVARYYEVWVLRLAGIFPSPWQCPGCGGSLVGEAAVLAPGEEIVCGECAPQSGRIRVSAAALDLLLRSARSTPLELDAQVAEPVLREVELSAARVRSAFLQQELRSCSVMKATLAGAGAPVGH
jgi:DNA repair protein RecO (recombination protein O)